MLRKLIFAAGASYLWRKFARGRNPAPGYSRTGLGNVLGSSRLGRRGF